MMNNDSKLSKECRKENIDINEIEKLINNDMNNIYINEINERNIDGDTPLITACKKCNHELVECLLKHKNIDINKKSRYGISPLMVACYFQDKYLVDLLIKHGADINTLDSKLNKPIDIARYLSNNDIIELIENKDKNLSKSLNSLEVTSNDIRGNTINIEGNTNYSDDTEQNEENMDFNSSNPKSLNSGNSYFNTENKNELIITNSNMEYLNIFIDEEIKKSICYFKKDNSHITGFFIKLPFQSKIDPKSGNPMSGIMTVNHILVKDFLRKGKFNIFMARNENNISMARNEDQVTEIQIQINENNFVFASELIDVTFIELSNEIIDKIKPHFLKPCEDASENESVLLFQYTQEKLSFSHGTITGSRGFNYFHNASTGSGSEGSPLLNGKHEVIGIHTSKRYFGNNDKVINDDEKVATKYRTIKDAIKTLYKYETINETERATERAKHSSIPLSKEELESLEKSGLNLKLESISKSNIEELKRKISKYEMKLLKKNLFSCNISKNNFLFYRTNYAWYVTILEKEIDISEYTFDYLKQLDWSLIDPYTEKFDKKIIDKIDGREYVLLTWLKLTELMYL